MALRVAADIGGTFTDLIFVDEAGNVTVSKIPSTPTDYARAVVNGVRETLKSAGQDSDDISELAHGTTVATNTVLERKGARVGLLTTRGFRDVLEIRRVRIPVLYDLTWQKPKDLVRRALRMEIPERMAAGGTVREPVDADEARNAILALKDAGVESVAICFLHSYANDKHEREIAKIAEDEFDYVSLSSVVMPEMREYERTATTVVDAYVKPIVSRYLKRLESGLSDIGCKAPISVMQSNGGVISDSLAADQPVRIIESGPAAGVVGAMAAGKHIGFENILSFDMGGTTAKASIIERGKFTLSSEYEVGGGLSQGSRLIKGGGHLIRVPAIDIAEIGAGGGSIAWIDSGGALKVGPESVGAEPGPACYAQGGEHATVTDANVVLGYLNPGYLVGGALKLDRKLAEKAIDRHVAKPLGLSVQDAAAGIHRVANAMMMRAIRSVSIERGRDPRDFALMAFGGSGPVHAAGLAAELEVSTVVIPPWPGVFSAVGLQVASFERLYSRSHLSRLARLDADGAQSSLEEIYDRARKEFAAEGFEGDSLELRSFADLRYRHQISEIMIPLPEGRWSDEYLGELAEDFHQEHRSTYGYDTRDEEVELVALKVRARGLRDSSVQNIDWQAAPSQKLNGESRNVYFGPDHGMHETRICGRGDIEAKAVAGPLVIEEYDSTVVVPPDWKIHQPLAGFLVLERQK